jgi:hypothetical protein
MAKFCALLNIESSLMDIQLEALAFFETKLFINVEHEITLVLN